MMTWHQDYAEQQLQDAWRYYHALSADVKRDYLEPHNGGTTANDLPNYYEAPWGAWFPGVRHPLTQLQIDVIEKALSA